MDLFLKSLTHHSHRLFGDVDGLLFLGCGQENLTFRGFAYKATVSLATVPPLLTTYADQVKRIGEQDVVRHAEIVQVYMDMGCDKHGAATKTSYQLDCQFEWKVIKSGINQIQKIAKVRALELDGLIVSPMHGMATPAFEAQVTPAAWSVTWVI